MAITSADAIRIELGHRLRLAYGTLEAAADAIGIPYKTLYRNLTIRGKDRTATVALDLVMQITDHLSAHFQSGDIADVYEASKRYRGLELPENGDEDIALILGGN